MKLFSYTSRLLVMSFFLSTTFYMYQGMPLSYVTRTNAANINNVGKHNNALVINNNVIANNQVIINGRNNNFLRLVCNKAVEHVGLVYFFCAFYCCPCGTCFYFA